jgi:hypothetical protein
MINVKLTITYPLIQSESVLSSSPCEEEKSNNHSIPIISQSVLDTMDHDILDRLELLGNQ